MVKPLSGSVGSVAEIGRISEDLHIRCWGPVRLEEETRSRPGEEEVAPPGEVGSGCLVVGRMMVQVSHCGGEVNQPPKEEMARRDHLARKGQFPNEGEKFPFGAGAPSFQLADGLLQLCLPLLSDGSCSWWLSRGGCPGR